MFRPVGTTVNTITTNNHVIFEILSGSYATIITFLTFKMITFYVRRDVYDNYYFVTY